MLHRNLSRKELVRKIFLETITFFTKQSKNRISQVTIVLLFWVVGFFQSFSDSVRFPDSSSYVLGNSTQDQATFSLIGNSWRAWPTVAFFALGNSDKSRVFYQTLLYLIAVTFFVFVTMIRKKGLAAPLGTLLLCSLFLSANVFQWNLSILSESTTISFILIGLSFAFLSFQNRSGSSLHFVAAETFLALASLVRPQLLIVLIAVGILWLSKRFSFPRLVLTTTVLFLLTPYIALVNTNISNYWSLNNESLGVTRNVVSFYYLTSRETRSDDLTNRLFAELPAGAPSCLTDLKSRASFVEEPGPIGFAQNEALRCPAGLKWINSNFVKFYAEFLLKHPWHIAETVVVFFPDGISESMYASVNNRFSYALNKIWTTNSLTLQKLFPFIFWFLIPILIFSSRFLNDDSNSKDTEFYIWACLNTSLLLSYLFMNSESARIGSVSAYPALALSIVCFRFFIEKAYLKIFT